jgi:type II secretory pathway component PulF
MTLKTKIGLTVIGLLTLYGIVIMHISCIENEKFTTAQNLLFALLFSLCIMVLGAFIGAIWVVIAKALDNV